MDIPGRFPDWPPGLPPLASAEPLAGGLVCSVVGGRLADGRAVVVKRCPYPAAVEADGLAALAAAGAPVPGVLAADGDVLVLDRVGVGAPGPTGAAWAALGRAVARLHRSTGPRFGWHLDNSGGRIPQVNTWCDDWPTFFVERRVRVHLADPAVPGPLRRRLERACAGPLPALLPERPPASLTHGDLWAGNVVVGRIGPAPVTRPTGGEHGVPAPHRCGAWLIDPAVSYADRELDLAFLDMGGGLPEEFGAAYRAEWPPDPGYPERRAALQLHKLLVNLRHFGARYVPRIEAVLDGYGW